MSWTLPLLGGVALVAQNALMIAMMGRGLGPSAALLVNSLVGLLLLAGVETVRSGGASITTALCRAELWFLLPGLLGTFFVFANLKSYQLLGVTATIVLVIAAQLLSGLAVDALGLNGLDPKPVRIASLIGAAMLLAGAMLVVRG